MTENSSRNQMLDLEYLSDRWQHDVRVVVICIAIVLMPWGLALHHDLTLLINGNGSLLKYTIFRKILFTTRIAYGLFSLFFVSWLLFHRNKVMLRQYERLVFLWQVILVTSAICGDLCRPLTYYLSVAVELPVIIMLYIIIPQHNRLLRILPPAAFSIALALLYHYYKMPPAGMDFSTLYLGLLFVNFIGIYFSEGMYQNDRRLYLSSNIDELSGLHNRRYLEKRAKEEWHRCLRRQSPVSILMVDIDFFKNYNDKYGHQAGDEVIRQVAVTLRGNVRRAGDLVARYGGEELIAILPDTPKEDGCKLAERIRSSIEKLRIIHEKSPVCPYLTVSIGVSAQIPNSEINYETVIHQADMALYQAKNQGRNRVLAFIG